MSKTNIPPKVVTQLWARAAGCCQYEGCNVELWLDSLTLSKMNNAYIAHIIADSPDGPRGDAVLSIKLSKEFSNLMLLCPTHHKLIDVDQVMEHPVALLQKMKKEHEERIQLVTSLTPEKSSQLLFYGSKIGVHGSPLNFDDAVQSILPHRYPANHTPIELGITNCAFEDSSTDYWHYQETQLVQMFSQTVQPLKSTNRLPHVSVFALAPMPLLIKLGTLLSDLYNADVYQLHREPATWKWQEDRVVKDYTVIPPENTEGEPVLNLSLSATITNDRIESVTGPKVSIWTVTHTNPNNDFLRSKESLTAFRQAIRKVLNEVKAVHGQNKTLGVFPAMPVSASVELGRVWMAKADLPMEIYDQNNKHQSFIKALLIK